MTEAVSIVANFAINSYGITASVSPANSGTVSGTGTYNHFETCTLTASPATGYHFVNWTLNGQGVGTDLTYSFVVTEAVAIVANFELDSFDVTAMVTANPADGGTVTGSGTYTYGQPCVLTANPAEGHHFVNWTVNGQVVGTGLTYSFTVTEAVSIVANFAINSYEITASVAPANSGTVSGTGTYNHFETCTLTASPATGYHFVNWTKGTEIVSTEEVYSFEVTENATIKAHFERNEYTVSAEANPEEGGTITGTGSLFHYNSTCQLTARPNTGYHFVNWTLNGVEVSTSNIYSFTVTASVHYVANFALDTFEITAIAVPEEGGVITGAGTYTYGQPVVLIAEASVDFKFVYWTEDDEIVSEDASYTFDAYMDRNLVAHFTSTVGITECDALTISIYPNPVCDRLTIEVSEPVKTLEVYTINGTLVSKQSNCSDMIEINVESYAIGTYMIRLTTDSAVEIRRFVKK